jgi:hypothetical protein
VSICDVQTIFPSTLKGKKINLPQLEIGEKEFKPYVPGRVQVECRARKALLVCREITEACHHCKVRLDWSKLGIQSAVEGYSAYYLPFLSRNTTRLNAIYFLMYYLVII